MAGVDDMDKLVDGLRVVRDVIVLGCIVLYTQTRWHLWERWKKGAPPWGPFYHPKR